MWYDIIIIRKKNIRDHARDRNVVKLRMCNNIIKILYGGRGVVYMYDILLRRDVVLLRHPLDNPTHPETPN